MNRVDKLLTTALQKTEPHGNLFALTTRPALAQHLKTASAYPIEWINPKLDDLSAYRLVGATVITDLPEIPWRVFDARHVVVVRYSTVTLDTTNDLSALLNDVMYLRVLTPFIVS